MTDEAGMPAGYALGRLKSSMAEPGKIIGYRWTRGEDFGDWLATENAATMDAWRNARRRGEVAGAKPAEAIEVPAAGQSFGRIESIDDAKIGPYWHSDERLRDEFAMAAPVTLEDSMHAAGIELQEYKSHPDNRAAVLRVNARMRYQHADAMLAARKVKS
jgi:hypothetical protein